MIFWFLLWFLAGIAFTLTTLFVAGWYAFRHPDILAPKIVPIIMKGMIGK